MKLRTLIKEELADMVRDNATDAPGSNIVKDNRLRFASPINAEFHNYEAFTADFDTKIDTVKITAYWRCKFLSESRRNF